MLVTSHRKDPSLNTRGFYGYAAGGYSPKVIHHGAISNDAAAAMLAWIGFISKWPPPPPLRETVRSLPVCNLGKCVCVHKLITRARSNQQLLLLLRLLLTFWGSRAAPVSEVRLNNMGLDVLCVRGFVVYFRSLFIGPDPKCDSLVRRNS